jgi:hypothetical protein
MFFSIQFFVETANNILDETTTASWSSKINEVLHNIFIYRGKANCYSIAVISW